MPFSHFRGGLKPPLPVEAGSSRQLTPSGMVGLANPLESAVTENAPATPLQSALRKSLDLNPPGISIYRKHRGAPPPCLLASAIFLCSPLSTTRWKMLELPGVDNRCRYKTADGRRCTMLRMADLCAAPRAGGGSRKSSGISSCPKGEPGPARRGRLGGQPTGLLGVKMIRAGFTRRETIKKIPLLKICLPYYNDKCLLGSFS